MTMSPYTEINTGDTKVETVSNYELEKIRATM